MNTDYRIMRDVLRNILWILFEWFKMNAYIYHVVSGIINIVDNDGDARYIAH